MSLIVSTISNPIDSNRQSKWDPSRSKVVTGQVGFSLFSLAGDDLINPGCHCELKGSADQINQRKVESRTLSSRVRSARMFAGSWMRLGGDAAIRPGPGEHGISVIFSKYLMVAL